MRKFEQRLGPDYEKLIEDIKFPEDSVRDLLKNDDFFELKRGSWLQKEPITLNPGRYLIYFDFDSDNTKVNCHMGIKGIFSYKATPKTLMSYRNFMCHFFRPQEIVTFYNFDPKSFFEKLGTKQVDPSFSNHGIKIFKVANWPKEAPLSLKDLVGCVR
jgi:hypothetical protein